MSPELEALAREAVACPRWRWTLDCPVHPVMADGTITDSHGIVVGFMGGVAPIVYWTDLRETRAHSPTDHLVPALGRPAAVGCLLALVREAHRRPRIVVVPGLSAQLDGSAWYVQDNPTDAASGYEPTLRRDGTFSSMSASPEVHGPSEPAALVAALRAAP